MHTKKGITLMITLAVIVSVAALFAGCVRITGNGVETITGSSKVETREFDYADFKDVTVGNAFKVDVTQSDSYRVSITMNENLFDYLDISQSGGTLTIRMKPHYSYLHATRQASINMPDLRVLKLSGATQGEVDGFSSTHPLEVDISGASSLDIDDLEAGDVNFDISGASKVSGSIEMANGRLIVSGASTVELRGSAADVTINVSGASRARLTDFPVADAAVDLSGASSATVNASGRLDVDLGGASRLTYFGNPTLGTVNVSGGSTLSEK